MSIFWPRTLTNERSGSHIAAHSGSSSIVHLTMNFWYCWRCVQSAAAWLQWSCFWNFHIFLLEFIFNFGVDYCSTVQSSALVDTEPAASIVAWECWSPSFCSIQFWLPAFAITPSLSCSLMASGRYHPRSHGWLGGASLQLVAPFYPRRGRKRYESDPWFSSVRSFEEPTEIVMKL